MPTFNLREEIKKRLENSWIYKSEYPEFSKITLTHALEDFHHDLKNIIFGEEEPEENTVVAIEIEKFIDRLNELQEPVEKFRETLEVIDINSLTDILVEEYKAAQEWAEKKRVSFNKPEFCLGLDRMINGRRDEIREREEEVGLETEAHRGSEKKKREAEVIPFPKFPKK
ncbi:MAG: hypothetical protein ABII72_03650 [Parcubacteria group bacterium]